MPYQVNWEVPQVILNLQLLDDVTMPEFASINDEINSHLPHTSSDVPLALMIDMTHTRSVPKDFKALMASQRYATTRSPIKWILVISSNRLMRLMMMLTYNLCRPQLHFFDTKEEALRFLEYINRGRQFSVS